MDVNKKVENQVEGTDKAPSTNGKKRAATKSNKTSQVSSLKKKLAQSNKERDELKDRLIRKAAEFENYRKRTESEFSQVVMNANAELITEILPVLDDVERLLSAGEQSGDIQTVYQGFELIYRNLVKILDKRGVKTIEAIGKEFDPEKHDALMQVENTESEPNMVVDEHLKGYEMNERVLRHSQVLVSK